MNRFSNSQSFLLQIVEGMEDVCAVDMPLTTGTKPKKKQKSKKANDVSCGQEQKVGV